MAAWLQTAMPLVVGIVTAGSAYLGVRHAARGNERATAQRDLAARREEWWRRFNWAAELAMDASPEKRALGLKLLTKLAESDLAGRDEWLLLDAFHERVLEPLLMDLDDEDEEESTDA